MLLRWHSLKCTLGLVDKALFVPPQLMVLLVPVLVDAPHPLECVVSHQLVAHLQEELLVIDCLPLLLVPNAGLQQLGLLYDLWNVLVGCGELVG